MNKLAARYEQLSKLLDRLHDPFLLLIRAVWGIQLFAIGLAKLTGLEGTSQFFASLGIPAPGLNAVLAGLTECLGGLFLAAGAAARVVAVPLIGVMVVAYLSAHGGEKLVEAKPFLPGFVCLIVLVFGAGRWSVDGWLRKKDAPASGEED